ncbi:MAG: hypothetical protein KGQ41_05885 [Alphaproteobacteria bacterium]|nr:hypothetical protein [Alphaproteobacteria bacterium]
MQNLNKVPQITLAFWLIKMMSTTVGETAADYLNFNLHLGLTLTSAIMGVLLALALVIQFKAKKYIPWVYWLAVVFISVFGTLVTDNLTDHFEVPLKVSTAVFGLLLVTTFWVWYAQEKTLSINAINTPKREAYYWLAILVTFALGTAAGDLISEDFGIGYLHAAMLFGGVIAATAAAHFIFRLNAVVTFWVVYVLTRPLGASCGDWLAQPQKYGGLGLGVINTSWFFLGAIALLIGWLSYRESKTSA